MTAGAGPLEPRTVDVWSGSLDQPAGVRDRLGSLLSADERERAARFRFDRDRERYVVGRGLLRSLLGRYVGVAPATPSPAPSTARCSCHRR